MESQRKPYVYYNYLDEFCRVRMEYDASTNELIVSCGKNLFSQLAEICSIYALADDTLSYETLNPNLARSSSQQIEFIFNKNTINN